MLAKGDVLNDRYVIEERVGSGGYGTVFRARDRKESRTVAVKALRGDLADDPDYRRRFRREADIARLLKSEHVVKVLESGHAQVRNEPVDFQIMEFVEGETLQERLRRGRVPIRKALYIAAQIAEALEEAESRGIVHRDVKPKNIFVGKGEFAQLGDFGIARATEYPSLKPDDPILGTPRYMSPEQCLGRIEETDSRSDVYALGIVLYEMIAGHPPFEGDSPNVISYKHVNEQAKALKSVAKHVPDDVEQLVQRCLQKRPEDRFQHPSELRAALWGAIDGMTSAEDTPITPIGVTPRRLPIRYRVKRLTRLGKSRGVRRVALALAVTGAIVGLGVGVWATAKSGDSSTSLVQEPGGSSSPAPSISPTSVALNEGGRGAPTPTQSSAVEPTVSQRYEPEFPTSTQDLTGISCQGFSLASPRSDAFRCTLGNILDDPCFSNSSSTIVDCSPDPRQSYDVSYFQVIGDLGPRNTGGESPWFIVLDAPLTPACWPLTGTHDLPTSQAFGCETKSLGECTEPEGESADLHVYCYPGAQAGWTADQLRSVETEYHVKEAWY